MRLAHARRRGAAGGRARPGRRRTRPWTRGIPLLHPWANRLGGFGFAFDGEVVALAPALADIYLEEHGLPLHGLRSAVHGWAVADASDRRLVAARDFAGVAEFPFDHASRSPPS